MSTRPSNDGRLWTRDELLLAFELYCRIPFQRTNSREPKVKELAALLGRTPGSVARKLGNLGAFDPALAAKNITGLAHTGKLDRVIWDEFHDDWGALVDQAHELRVRLQQPGVAAAQPPAAPTGPSERVVTAKQRLHQAFFRDSVLSSYGSRCCVTGLPIPECLVAGHIIPWSVDERRRADPTNGVCMSATFDRLFDSGLITIRDDLRLDVSGDLVGSEDPAVVET